MALLFADTPGLLLFFLFFSLALLLSLDWSGQQKKGADADQTDDDIIMSMTI